jgi:nucleoside 2-deoxyribosyltransferase
MKSVVISSSNRFAEEALAFASELKKQGVRVYVAHYYTHNYGSLEGIKDHNKKFIAMGLTLDHFQKIRKADTVFLFNKDGYAGNSTTLELGFAVALSKPVYALSDKDEEVCRDILFDGYAATPAELLKHLV